MCALAGRALEEVDSRAQKLPCSFVILESGRVSNLPVLEWKSPHLSVTLFLSACHLQASEAQVSQSILSTCTYSDELDQRHMDSALRHLWSTKDNSEERSGCQVPFWQAIKDREIRRARAGRDDDFETSNRGQIARSAVTANSRRNMASHRLAGCALEKASRY